MCRRGIAALFTLLLVHSVAGLYQDQAGTFDWHRQYLGAITDAHLLSKRACGISEQKAVGCLELSDGSIAWRKVLDDADGVQASAHSEKHSLYYTVSHGAAYLRAWDVSDGQLRWEVPLSGAAPGAGAALAVSRSGSALFVASGPSMQVRQVANAPRPLSPPICAVRLPLYSHFRSLPCCLHRRTLAALARLNPSVLIKSFTHAGARRSQGHGPVDRSDGGRQRPGCCAPGRARRPSARRGVRRRRYQRTGAPLRLALRNGTMPSHSIS